MPNFLYAYKCCLTTFYEKKREKWEKCDNQACGAELDEDREVAHKIIKVIHVIYFLIVYWIRGGLWRTLTKYSIEIQFFIVWGQTRFTWSINCSQPLLYTITKEHHCQISREPNISFIGAYCAILHHWSDQAHCAFCTIGDRHHQISLIHTTKFETSLWYQLKDFETPSQNTSLLGGVVQILIYPRSFTCLADVGLFVKLHHDRFEWGERILVA